MPNMRLNCLYAEHDNIKFEKFTNPYERLSPALTLAKDISSVANSAESLPEADATVCCGIYAFKGLFYRSSARAEIPQACGKANLTGNDKPQRLPPLQDKTAQEETGSTKCMPNLMLEAKISLEGLKTVPYAQQQSIAAEIKTNVDSFPINEKYNFFLYMADHIEFGNYSCPIIHDLIGIIERLIEDFDRDIQLQARQLMRSVMNGLGFEHIIV
ncbi:hypothetical protein ACL2XP_07505 [Sodalis sp. RH21]|uniref:hypothetical protein n=1 Tax=unclassified Sodalis (in: enterobacteria) TaxID=2636512 RepID=UPI0039B5FF5D